MDKGYLIRIIGSVLLAVSLVIYYAFGRENISNTLGFLVFLFLVAGLAILLVGIKYMKFQNDKRYEKFVQSSSRKSLWIFLGIIVLALIIAMFPSHPLAWGGLAIVAILLIFIIVDAWRNLFEAGRYLKKTYSKEK